ncbi:hypothetical protein ACLB2K_051738 [Fragaria x ananassa]
MENYFKYVQEIADELEESGSPVNERELISHIIPGLHPPYDELVSSVMNRPRPITGQELLHLLQSHEYRLVEEETDRAFKCICAILIFVFLLVVALGIGFKSVFLITAQPYIFSNGYQIRFNEDPCVHCNVGFIVPEWVDQNPTLSDIKKIYGSSAALPTTTLILPPKADKVKPVKQQLSNIHPEVLLFLSKIKRLSVRKSMRIQGRTLLPQLR